MTLENGQKVTLWDSPSLVESEKEFIGKPGTVVTAGRQGVVVKLDEPVGDVTSYVTLEENLERVS